LNLKDCFSTKSENEKLALFCEEEFMKRRSLGTHPSKSKIRSKSPICKEWDGKMYRRGMDLRDDSSEILTSQQVTSIICVSVVRMLTYHAYDDHISLRITPSLYFCHMCPRAVVSAYCIWWHSYSFLLVYSL